MFSNVNLDQVYSQLSALQIKYKKASLDEKKQMDAQVIAIMQKAEEANKQLQSLKTSIQSVASDRTLKNIASASERFVSHAKEKQEKEEEQKESFLHQMREMVREMRDELKKAPEKKEEKKEKDLLDRVEETLMKATKEKREYIASQIESRYGQGAFSRKMTEFGKGAYDLAKKKGIINPSEEVDDAVNLAYEANNLRNDIVKEACDVVLKPRESLAKYFQSAT